jgi:hypothetical protein
MLQIVNSAFRLFNTQSHQGAAVFNRRNNKPALEKRRSLIALRITSPQEVSIEHATHDA